LANKLVLRELHAGYGAVRVLHGVSLRLEGTEIVVLLGTNGNGKSTLMKCVMGMVKSDSGELYLESEGKRIDLRDKSTEEVVGLGISLIPEGRRLFPGLTVQENLLIGAYRLGARQKLKENLRLNYEIFPRIGERKNQVAGSLSGGEQQMLAVARSIMSNPRVLLVDEPSVGLAPLFVNHVLTKIKELKEKYNLSILLSEQNFAQATKIADRGYILVEGKIVFEGKDTRELKEHELVKKFYLGV
jgi:branched-chain amino acid transport system ATP-binding protein